MKGKKPVFQESAVFINDFLSHAQKAKKRIWVETMFFEPGPVTKKLEEILLSGVKRHVDVRFTVDWVTSKYYDDHLRLFPSIQRRCGQWKYVDEERQHFLQRLKQKGILISVVHKPGVVSSILTMGGRNHNKIYIVDDTAWIGGVNLTAEMKSRDVMMRFSDAKTLGILERCFLSADSTSNDFSRSLARNYTFYYDSGRPNRSIILDEAVHAVLSAKEKITLVSQFIPDMHILLALVKKANDGIQITIITGDKHSDIFTKFPYNFFYLLYRLRMRNNRHVSLYHYNGSVHAKLLLIDDRKLFIGSHNFIWSTVLLGTTEIAVKIEDPKIISDSHIFIGKLLSNAQSIN